MTYHIIFLIAPIVHCSIFNMKKTIYFLISTRVLRIRRLKKYYGQCIHNHPNCYSTVLTQQRFSSILPFHHHYQIPNQNFHQRNHCFLTRRPIDQKKVIENTIKYSKRSNYDLLRVFSPLILVLGVLVCCAADASIQKKNNKKWK